MIKRTFTTHPTTTAARLLNYQQLSNIRFTSSPTLFHHRHIHTGTDATKEEVLATPPKKILTEKQVEEHYFGNHIPLGLKELLEPGTLFRSPQAPYTDTKMLEEFDPKRHKKPDDFNDKLAYGIMRFLRIFVHWFFGKRYIHHAVVLETVAAVPGMVAGALRHMTSLRRMDRDYGWIGPLLEEAENERVHLLTWMHVAKPSLLERMLVLLAQFVYGTFYTIAYIASPRFAHRLVGYLEEEAVDAYTQFLESIDKGEIDNVPAPEMAKRYWNLSPDATLRDVVLVVRADECMHRDYNHQLSTHAAARKEKANKQAGNDISL